MVPNDANIEKMSPREEVIRDALQEHGIALPDDEVRRIAKCDSKDLHAILLNELRSLRESNPDPATLAKQLKQINRKLDQTVKKEHFLLKAGRVLTKTTVNVLTFPIRYPITTIIAVLGTAYFGLPMLFQYLADKEFAFAKTTIDWFQRYQKSQDPLHSGFGGSPEGAAKILGGRRDRGGR